MNEMLLDAGFMNGVTSLFVPNLCFEQDNKVSGALVPPTKIVECVDEFNYLGLIINKHLKWNSHVNKIGNKISQTIGVI